MRKTRRASSAQRVAESRQATKDVVVERCSCGKRTCLCGSGECPSWNRQGWGCFECGYAYAGPGCYLPRNAAR